MEQEIVDYHVEYMDVTQHWHPESEKFAGGDCLLTYLANGWVLSMQVKHETKWYAGMRFVNIYHFELTRNGETLVMPVINNPFVDKFLMQPSFRMQMIANAD